MTAPKVRGSVLKWKARAVPTAAGTVASTPAGSTAASVVVLRRAEPSPTTVSAAWQAARAASAAHPREAEHREHPRAAELRQGLATCREGERQEREQGTGAQGCTQHHSGHHDQQTQPPVGERPLGGPPSSGVRRIRPDHRADGQPRLERGSEFAVYLLAEAPAVTTAYTSTEPRPAGRP